MQFQYRLFKFDISEHTLMTKKLRMKAYETGAQFMRMPKSIPQALHRKLSKQNEKIDNMIHNSVYPV